LTEYTEAQMGERRKISLVAADVDGTLVTEQKVLTQRAQAAVQALHRAGIRFAITSGRPPRGMATLFDALGLDTPIAGFNGGLFVRRDLSIVEQKTVEPDIARQALALIREHGLDAWIYSGNDWLITKPGAPHVAREAWTVKFEPKVVADFDDRLDSVAKIVGVSDHLDRVRRCEADAQAAFGSARDGKPVAALLPRRHPQGCEQGRGGRFSVRPPGRAGRGDRNHRRPAERCADVQAIGAHIAVGNASDQVKSQADVTTDSYNDEGFAKAIERFVLPPVG
jgi:hydroxymethylpyrimidine pyrophosphatase-like HAD family hydrolase